MSKVLPLSRWKREKLPEREEFSDVEDSDDEDSGSEEEIAIPKKRHLKGDDKEPNKRKKLNPQPRLKIPKKQQTRPKPQLPKKRPLTQGAVPKPPPGPPPKRFKPGRKKPSKIPSRR